MRRGRCLWPGLLALWVAVTVNGSHANGDFNDYVLYVSNIQPKGGIPKLDWSR